MSKEILVEQLILDEILSERIKAGEMMEPERHLAIKYNCSRPVVHKAIIRLEHKGVVKIRPRRGIQVLDFHITGRLSLIEDISCKSKDSLSRKLNEDMLAFIMDNFRNIIRSFDSIEKKPSKMDLKTPEEFFELFFDYSCQSGNGIYPMLANEFKIGIMNVAKCCTESVDIHNLFCEIERNIMDKKIVQALTLVNLLHETIKIQWIGGLHV